MTTKRFLTAGLAAADRISLPGEDHAKAAADKVAADRAAALKTVVSRFARRCTYTKEDTMTTTPDPIRPNLTDLSLASQPLRDILGGHPANLEDAAQDLLNILDQYIARELGHHPVHLRIVQGHDLIADLPEWPHPIPRVGDYILHPPSSDTNPEGIAGPVKSVTWRTHDRAEDKFVTTARPYVELAI